VKQLSYAQLAALSQQARTSPRRRMNHNMHTELSDPIQRLAIAMEPDTYIRPHHHRHSWELLTALRGRFVVLNFDAAGVVTERVVLGEDASIIETPMAGWHAVLSLDPGGVIFEVKHGPYAPFSENDFASWSPPADTDASRELMAWYASAAVGQRWPG
jgi:cupin fold WbuC family metalloprotein